MLAPPIVGIYSTTMCPSLGARWSDRKMWIPGKAGELVQPSLVTLQRATGNGLIPLADLAFMRNLQVYTELTLGSHDHR
jgi:hypothetical protein